MMTVPATDLDQAVATAISTLAGLEALSRVDQPLLVSAARRGHAALSLALSSVAPEVFEELLEDLSRPD